jgi:hypothetical protein
MRVLVSHMTVISDQPLSAAPMIVAIGASAGRIGCRVAPVCRIARA